MAYCSVSIWSATLFMRAKSVASRLATSDERVLFLAGGALVLVAYSVTLSIANDLWISDAIIAGAANAAPTILFGAAVYWIVARFVVRRPVIVQVVAHLLLCAAFALLTYWLLLVLLGIVGSASALDFEVRPFVSRAMAWQMLQNVTVYGLIATLACRRVQTPAPTSAGPDTEEDLSGGLSRYFIRKNDEIVPIDVSGIVSISGADDYTEMATATGRHLTRLTLSRFEQTLNPDQFIRIHRSAIVNLEHDLCIEPAGDGRLLVHMDDGQTITTSRSGARAIRSRVI